MFTSNILSDRQQAELNKAILQYLETAIGDNDETLEKLATVLGVSQDDSVIPNYLEKKWSTVLRLQKRIIDLENEVSNLRSVLDTSAPNVVISKDRINWLPYSATRSFLSQQLLQTCSIHPVFPLVAAGSVDGEIMVWNLGADDTGIPDKLLKAHTRSVMQVVWSNSAVEIDGNAPDILLASCSSDLSIKVYGSNYQHLRTLTGHEHTISSIRFSKQHPHILYSVSRDKSVRVWDLTTGYCVRSFVGHSEWVRDIDVAGKEHGDFVVTCSNDQSARLSHESGTGVALFIGHSHVVECVRFLPQVSCQILDKYVKSNMDLFPTVPPELLDDEIYVRLGFKYCVTGSRDNTLKLWLIPPPTIVPHRTPLPAKYNNSQAWLVSTFSGHQSWVKSVSVHPNGRFIFSGSDDKSIKVWDLEALNVSGNVSCARSLQGHEGFVNAVEFASNKIVKPDKEKPKEKEASKNDPFAEQLEQIQSTMRCLFVSCGSDNTVKVWS